MKISVIIPVYKKVDMFMKHLRHNMQFLKNYEIIVVDDASQENIGDLLHTDFPDVIYIESKVNEGFAPTVNKGIRAATGDLIILMNTDVKMIEHLPSTYTKKFDDPKLFGLSWMQKEKDGSYVGKNVMYFKDGLPQHAKSKDIQPGITAWAEGGSCMLRKKHLDVLGGFQELYRPFYWEDNDVSYRAYSHGWHVLFDPDVCVEHHHESTISTFYTKERVRGIAFRNQLLFTWANITDSSLFFHHILMLPKLIGGSLLRGDTVLVKGCIAALMRLPEAIKARRRKSASQSISDKEIFSLFEPYK